MPHQLSYDAAKDPWPFIRTAKTTLTPEMRRGAAALWKNYDALDLEIITSFRGLATDFLTTLPSIEGYENDLYQLAMALTNDLRGIFCQSLDKPLRLRFSIQNAADSFDDLLLAPTAHLIVMPAEEDVRFHLTICSETKNAPHDYASFLKGEALVLSAEALTQTEVESLTDSQERQGRFTYSQAETYRAILLRSVAALNQASADAFLNPETGFALRSLIQGMRSLIGGFALYQAQKTGQKAQTHPNEKIVSLLPKSGVKLANRAAALEKTLLSQIVRPSLSTATRAVLQKTFRALHKTGLSTSAQTKWRGVVRARSQRREGADRRAFASAPRPLPARRSLPASPVQRTASDSLQRTEPDFLPKTKAVRSLPRPTPAEAVTAPRAAAHGTAALDATKTTNAPVNFDEKNRPANLLEPVKTKLFAQATAQKGPSNEAGIKPVQALPLLAAASPSPESSARPVAALSSPASPDRMEQRNSDELSRVSRETPAPEARQNDPKQPAPPEKSAAQPAEKAAFEEKIGDANDFQKTEKDPPSPKDPDPFLYTTKKTQEAETALENNKNFMAAYKKLLKGRWHNHGDLVHKHEEVEILETKAEAKKFSGAGRRNSLQKLQR